MIIVQFSRKCIPMYLTCAAIQQTEAGYQYLVVFEFPPLSQHQISCAAMAKTIYLKVRQERVLRFDPGHHNIHFYYYFSQSNKWPITLEEKKTKKGVGKQVQTVYLISFGVFSMFFFIIDRVILPLCLFFCLKWLKTHAK